MTTAQAAKQEGMERVDAHANEAWKRMMEKVVVATARIHQQFTADDVYDLVEKLGSGLPCTHDDRAFGPVMLRAAKAGVCKKTDRVIPSRRASCHARPKAVWESQIYGVAA